MIFTCARVSHALLSLRKNGGSLSLSAVCNSFVALYSEDLCPLAVRRSGMFSNLELRTLGHPRSCTYILNVYRSNSLFTKTNTSCTSVILFPGSSLTEPLTESLYGRTSVRRSRYAFIGGAVLKQACAKVESLQNFHTWQIIVSILSVNLVQRQRNGLTGVVKSLTATLSEIFGRDLHRAWNVRGSQSRQRGKTHSLVFPSM